MAILEILHYPDSRLHLKATKIAAIDDKIKTLIHDMTETMYESEGVGLAATQVNVQQRIFIMDISSNDQPRKLQVFINPVILALYPISVAPVGLLGPLLLHLHPRHLANELYYVQISFFFIYSFKTKKTFYYRLQSNCPFIFHPRIFFLFRKFYPNKEILFL